MPPKFDACVKSGGRVRTVKPSAEKYLKVCFGESGKSTPGEVKTTKGTKDAKDQHGK